MSEPSRLKFTYDKTEQLNVKQPVNNYDDSFEES